MINDISYMERFIVTERELKIDYFLITISNLGILIHCLSRFLKILLLILLLERTFLIKHDVKKIN